MDQNKAKEHIGAEKSHKIILFAGRIDPVKGLTALLFALKIMLQQNPDCSKVCLWIVGGDVSQEPHLWSKELQKLKQIRNLLHLTTTVKFVGQKPQEELPYYYNAAELVVMPSDYESFGMTALEAIACGAPIIVSNVAGISNLFGKHHQKLITTANNPLLLAKQMAHLLKKPVIHSPLENIEEMDWKNVAGKIASVYKKLLA
jgi:D-inositol-3-phosphate glycosyltransferase